MSAISFSTNPRIIADGAYVTTITSATWDSRPDGTTNGDVLYVTDTGMAYVWNSTVSRWIPAEISSQTFSELATVVGDNANLATEGWTVGGSNAGTTTTDGTSVTIEISGTSSSIVEVWNMTALATAANYVYVGGYLSFGIPAFGQAIVQVLRGVDYFTLARNSGITTGGTPIVVRGTASTAFRQNEYETPVTNTDENWWDIILPPGGSTGQMRIYLNHEPWFGCAMNQIPGGSSFNALQIGCNPLHSGTRNVSLTIRDFVVLEGA